MRGGNCQERCEGIEGYYLGPQTRPDSLCCQKALDALSASPAEADLESLFSEVRRRGCKLESSKRCWVLRRMPLSCGATQKSSRKPCVLSQSQLRLRPKPGSLKRWRQSGTCARTARPNLRLTSGPWQVLWKPWTSVVSPRNRRRIPAMAERIPPLFAKSIGDQVLL